MVALCETTIWHEARLSSMSLLLYTDLYLLYLYFCALLLSRQTRQKCYLCIYLLLI